MTVTDSLRRLARGAFATAVSQACGLIIGLPAVDPDHFNFVNWKGAWHVFAAVAYVVLIGECRYFKDWADAIKDGNGHGKT